MTRFFDFPRRGIDIAISKVRDEVMAMFTNRMAPRYFLLTTLRAAIADAEGHIVDLSAKGARLELTKALPVGAKLPMKFSAAAGAVEVPATVLWCRMAAMALDDNEEDRFFAGVIFDQPIPLVERIIAELVASDAALAIQDYRKADRYRVTAALVARYGTVPNARVLDISVRGARISSPAALPVGTTAPLRFRIQGHETPAVMATVVWSRPAERKGGFETGLCVDGEEEWLHAVIEELALRNEVTVDTTSMRRKFEAFPGEARSGLVELIG